MGAWGVGPFDNDDASDWAYEFDELDGPAGLQVVSAAIERAQPGEYLESPEGANIVAAAAVVAWTRDPSNIPDSPYGEAAAMWVRTARPRPTDELIAGALAALDHVRSDNSELAELWAESGDADWRASLMEIEAQLRA
jgi:hypothetical protein